MAELINETVNSAQLEYQSEVVELESSGYYGAPTGTIEITENGTHDVSAFASADVQVEPSLMEKSISDNGTYTASDDNVDGYFVVNVDVQPTLQEKSVNPSSSAQEVTADSNYDGLSKVTVGGAPLQNKSITPSTSAQSVQADDGYYGLGEVEVGAAPLESKTITPTTTQQTVYPQSPNIGFSDVTVEAIPYPSPSSIVDRSVTEYTDTTTTIIGEYAFSYCSNLQKVSIPNATMIGDNAFRYSLLFDNESPAYYFPKVESLGEHAFRDLQYKQTEPPRSIFLPKLTSLYANSFTGTTRWVTIAIVILKQKASLLSYYAGSFSIRNSGNAGFYVPQRYFNWYTQEATNWVAGYGSYPNSIQTIEDNIDYLVSLGYDRDELLAED